MSQIKIFIKGFPVHLTESNDGQYKADPFDLTHSANLDFIDSIETLKQLLEYLNNDLFSEALKWVCYNSDITLPLARKRVLKFLLTNLLCLLTYSISEVKRENDLSIMRAWISGINQTYYTGKNILDLLVSEGYSINIHE